MKGSNKRNNDDGNGIESKDTDRVEHDDFVQANGSDGKKDVLIDDEHLPQSQNCFASSINTKNDQSLNYLPNSYSISSVEGIR